MHLACPPETVIEKVLFASLGNPTGECSDTLLRGTCHFAMAPRMVSELCLGKSASSFGDALREIYQASVVRADFILVCAVP